MTGPDLRAIRLRLGLTQSEMAERVGLTWSGYCRQERGERAVSRQTELLALQAAAEAAA